MAIPTLPHPTLYVSDINYQHVNWGYNKTSPGGEKLDSWATSNNPGLLYNPKETASYISQRWNVGTNPDLAFVSLGQESRLNLTEPLRPYYLVSGRSKSDGWKLSILSTSLTLASRHGEPSTN